MGSDCSFIESEMYFFILVSALSIFALKFEHSTLRFKCFLFRVVPYFVHPSFISNCSCYMTSRKFSTVCEVEEGNFVVLNS